MLHSILIADSGVATWVAISISAISILLGLAQSFVLARVQRNQKLQDDERENHSRRVATLELSLANADRKQHELVEKLIDERFRGMSHEVRNQMNGIVLAMEEVKSRLLDGEGQFGTLTATDHQIELKMVGKFETIKDWMRDTFAGKQDLIAHESSMARKVEILDQHIRGLEISVATASGAGGNSGGKVKQP